MIDVNVKCETQDELKDLRKNILGAIEKVEGVENAEDVDDDITDTTGETND